MSQEGSCPVEYLSSIDIGNLDMHSETNQELGSRETKVFISHSQKDSDIANFLTETCRDAGISTWDASSQIQYGENFQEKINEAIESCNVFVVLVSQSTQSDSPLREWSAICERNWTQPEVRIIPVRLDESEVPAFLKGLKTLDGRNKQALKSYFEQIADHSAAQIVPKRQNVSEEEQEEVAQRFHRLLESLSAQTKVQKPI